MENGVVNEREKRISNALKELQRQSSLVYTRVLESPVLGGFSGWDKVRPCPVYDFNTPPCCKPTPSKKSNSRFPRSLRHKPAATPPTTSYMSGDYDENYSYVYSPGLSKRCRREIARNAEKNSSVTRPPLPHPPVHPLISHHPVPHPPVVYPQSGLHVTQSPAPKATCSTVYLDPDISQPPSLKQKEAQLQSELSKVVKMQMKPELLVEQIIIENRLRALGGMKTHSSRYLNLDVVGMSPKITPSHFDKGIAALNKTAEQQSRSAPSLLPPSIPHPHQKPPPKSKSRRKTKPVLDWCSLHNPEVASSPRSSLQRTSGAIIASARKEVSNMNSVLSVKSSSAKTSPQVIGSLRKTPNFTVGNGFVSHAAGIRLRSLNPQPLGARNHSGGTRLSPASHPNFQIT